MDKRFFDNAGKFFNGITNGLASKVITIHFIRESKFSSRRQLKGEIPVLEQISCLSFSFGVGFCLGVVSSTRPIPHIYVYSITLLNRFVFIIEFPIVQIIITSES